MLEHFGWLKHIGDWLLSWSKRRRDRLDRVEEGQQLRRREVREELVKFHQLIHDTDRGAWPPNTFESWAPLRQRVLEQRRKIQHLLDVDRKGAGLEWCTGVEDCLQKGWELFHNHFGQSTLRVGRLHDEMPALREAYYSAYKKVTEE